MKIYLVGGAVRDQLLNYPSTEKDWVVVGASPEQMTAAGFTPVGKDFPVFLHPDTHEEYALARTERKSGRGYAGFTFATDASVTLEQDLARRDLTINAIAQDEHGALIDPYGGQADIANRQLRHVSPAFAEDPVRVLRVARFAARYHHLGFRVADDTLALMRAMVANGEVSHLVAERSCKEFLRALGERSPHVFIEVLRACGALAGIMPELDRLFGVPQPPQHHPEIDSGVHSLLALARASALSDKVNLRCAALLHDLGKGLTPAEQWPRHLGHERAGLAPIKALCQRLRLPNEARELSLLAAEYHTHCHRALELKPATLLRTLEALDAFRRPQRFADFLLCCQADAQGRTGLSDQPYPQADFFAAVHRVAGAVDSAPLLAQGWQGKALGDELRRQRQHAIAAYKSQT